LAPLFENPVKQRLQQGQPVIGHWISFPSSSVAELMASIGMDWLMIDTEHGPANWETVEDIIRAMKGTAVTPLVRVVANDPALIKLALDRGAFGVLVPLVNTVEQARAAAAASRYPPEGIRGVAGTRVNRYGGDLPQYFTEWNRQVLVACQIETGQALENVEAIAAVEGIDVLFVGPNDLSANLNRFRRFDDPEFVRAVDRILQAARRHGKAVGYMAANDDDALARIDQGFRFIALGSDARLLAGAAAATYEKIRRGLRARTTVKD
jgi:2-keto-3-deoxy-L-rhamnonate aldolase RhmA